MCQMWNDDRDHRSHHVGLLLSLSLSLSLSADERTDLGALCRERDELHSGTGGAAELAATRQKHLASFVTLQQRKFSPALFKIGAEKKRMVALIFYYFTLAPYVSMNRSHPGYNQWRWWENLPPPPAGRSVRPSSCRCHCYNTRAAESLIRRSHTALMSYGGGCTRTHKRKKKKSTAFLQRWTQTQTHGLDTHTCFPPNTCVWAHTHTHTHTPGSEDRGAALDVWENFRLFLFLDKQRKTSQAIWSEIAAIVKHVSQLWRLPRSPRWCKWALHHCHNGPSRPVVLLKSFRWMDFGDSWMLLLICMWT